MDGLLDKSWMTMDRRLREYNEGVDRFLKFAALNANGRSIIRCPCIRCTNHECLPTTEVKDHLFIHGIDKRYGTWIWHGEQLPTRASSSRNANNVDTQQFQDLASKDVPDIVEMVNAAQDQCSGIMEQDSDSNISASASGRPSYTNSPTEKRKRGPTKLTPSWQRNGRKILVVLNKKSQPIGPTRADVGTECGRICRSFCPINCDSWKRVPDSVKAKIMVEIEENFECHSLSNWQHAILNMVRDRFTDFKTRLYTKFILPYLDDFARLVDPPSKYTSITPEQWRGFVMQRTSKDWAAKREKAQAARKQNLYPHRLSRKGYAGLEEELQCKRKTNEPIPRHILWTEARVKDGECSNEKVSEKIDLIKSISSQVEDGSLIAQGRNDVLAQALQMPEHGGRVRGLGRNVTLTSYFNIPQPTNSVMLNQMMKMQKFMVALAFEVQRLGGQVPELGFSDSLNEENIGSYSGRCTSGLQTESQKTSPSPQVPGSRKNRKRKTKCDQVVEEPNCTPNVQSLEKNIQNDEGNEANVQMDAMSNRPVYNMKKSNACYLALGTIDQIVARGQLCDDVGSNVLHGIELNQGIARVSLFSLERSEYAEKRLPIPNGGATTLNDALGGYVAWPRHLIITREEMVISRPNEGEIDYKDIIASFEKLFDRATQDDEDRALIVEVDVEVFKTCDQKSEFVVDIPVLRDDLMHVIKFEEIGITLIKVYMCTLFDKLKETELERRSYRFAPPASRRGCTTTANQEVLYSSMNTAEQDQIFFYPFNIGFHWVLAVIDPWSRHTLYFDPLGNVIDRTLRCIITNACKTLDFTKKFKPSKKMATFDIVQCPKQSGGIECGYYVMKYMKDIVESKGTQPSKLFASNKSYGSSQLDEVRVELLEYIRDHS